MALTVIAGPIALIVTLLASWPALTVTRARTCLVIGVVMGSIAKLRGGWL